MVNKLHLVINFKAAENEVLELRFHPKNNLFGFQFDSYSGRSPTNKCIIIESLHDTIIKARLSEIAALHVKSARSHGNSIKIEKNWVITENFKALSIS